MLNVGDRAPAFEAHTDSGDAVTLDGLRAEGPFVLYFYPADFTPVCTKEACMFRDAHPRLVEAGVRVFGVSPQGASSHAAFREKHDLNFPLLADPDKQIVKAYGATLPLGLGVRRVSYLIGQDGVIADRAVADLRVGPHEAFVDRVVARGS